MGTKGPRQRRSRKSHGHRKCPRCGNKSYNGKYCAKCGYGKSKRRND